MRGSRLKKDVVHFSDEELFSRNPQKVGSEPIGVKTARLQAVSRCERDFLRGGGAAS